MRTYCRFKEAQKGFSAALNSKLDGGWCMSHVSIAYDQQGMGHCALMLANYTQV
jgi:hypothetical protein